MSTTTVQRARRPEHKEARAREILDGAWALVRDEGFAGFTMADLASRVGLAKGTLFLYFPTKEALGVALVERALGEWFDEVDALMAQVEGVVEPAALAQGVGASVGGREHLVGLLGLLGSLFEHNVDEATAARFKRWLLSRLTRSGALLENAVPYLAGGGGMRFLVQLHALVVGLHQHAKPPPAVARVLEAPELAPLRIDFTGELVAATHALLEGMRVLSSKREAVT